jgi:pilus assembly protein CpaF
MSTLNPKHLTSVHVFDFGRKQRVLFLSIRDSVTLGTHARCTFQLPTPSALKSQFRLGQDHKLYRYSSLYRYYFRQGKLTQGFSPPHSVFHHEEPNISITIKRSWNPFETLIDDLVEHYGSSTPTGGEGKLEAWLKQQLPQEILECWSLQTILDSFLKHSLGMGELDAFMRDSTITEILINGSQSVYVESEGHLKRAEFTLSPLRLERLIARLTQHSQRAVNTRSPICDFQLPTGERVNVVLEPVSKQGPLVSIRKHKRNLKSLEHLAACGMFSLSTLQTLKALVQSRKNILVSGGTGTGKTTLLNAMLAECPPDERMIVVEDTTELKPTHPHLISLETRPASVHSQTEIPMQQLMKTALRMRPTRIICGECRGPEAFQMLLAMNSGHPGSMTTLHANSPKEAVYRLEVFLLMAGFDVPHRALRQFVLASIDTVIQLERSPDGHRKISEMVNLCKTSGSDDLQFSAII